MAAHTAEGVPALTQEDRRRALDSALEARRRRAAFKAEVESGSVSVRDAIVRAREDEVLGKIKVLTFLQFIPGYGRVRASRLLAKLGISETRRMRGIGSVQLSNLLDEFAE